MFLLKAWTPFLPTTAELLLKLSVAVADTEGKLTWRSGREYNPNTLTGTNSIDLIRGLGGNDTLNGLGSNDEMYGGAGRDTINGGDGNDLIYGNAGADLIDGGLGNDIIYGGDGQDVVLGRGGNDNLFGNIGNDEVQGGNGNDLINGGNGADDLFGGKGQDGFFFYVGSGRDQIFDFENNEDTLYIDKDFGFNSVQEVLDNCSSSGGDSAVDLSKTGADFPRIILFGVDNFQVLANDIVLI